VAREDGERLPVAHVDDPDAPRPLMFAIASWLASALKPSGPEEAVTVTGSSGLPGRSE